ncbi:hypothetical protein [Hyalangium rubrum]|uniref:Uncharacterized protein n=1 Tax=Hyalangium rubrum TaxID=3103134 RepID=A0ABU5HFK3_9BACT|nr:hypothetical protein [Hyalangium sp. s54d21]MDY7232250.1 hypothetical protein [Hyalangium sp. s54d21]
MLIVGSMLVGSIIFFGIILLTILFGAFGKESEKDMLARTERERNAGLEGNSDPLHGRYVEI